MNSTNRIVERINEFGEGIIFTYSDLQLPPNMQAAAAMSLSRMVAENKLKRISKGKFYKPAYSRLGQMTPLIDELTKDLLYKNERIIGYITGIPMFAQLGLTSQITPKILIGSNTYRRPLVREGYEISFTRQVNPITEENIPFLRFLDAIKFIRKILGCTPENAVKVLMDKISAFTRSEIELLIQLVSLYPASTRAIFGAMVENVGYEVGEIKKGINPLTKYNLNISDIVLPNKSNWNIL